MIREISAIRGQKNALLSVAALPHWDIRGLLRFFFLRLTTDYWYVVRSILVAALPLWEIRGRGRQEISKRPVDLGNAFQVHARRLVVEQPLEVFLRAGAVAGLQAQMGSIQTVEDRIGVQGHDHVKITQCVRRR